MKKMECYEGAVSPVIGVILMVAITVILAAVVTALVFGMVSNVAPSGSVIGITVSKISDSSVVFTNMGGDTDDISSIIVIAENDDGTNQTKTLGNAAAATVKITGGTFTGNNRMMAVGTLSNGVDRILLDTSV